MVTKIGQVAQELSAGNTWWRDANWWRADVDLADADHRDLGYTSNCLAGLVPGGLYILRGPRRVGKTVSTKQAIRELTGTGVDPRSVVSVAVDGWTERELRTLVTNVALPPIGVGTTRWWFIDEITAVKGDWASQIKWLRDNDADFKAATVVLTGSNATGLTKAIGVLAGRRGQAVDADRTLLPIGFRTFCHLLDPTVADAALPALHPTDLHSPTAATAIGTLQPWLHSLTRLWETYLSYGGFPIATAAAKAATAIPPYFSDAIFDVVFHDAFRGARLSETDTTALLDRLGQNLCSPMNLSTTARDLDLSFDQIRDRINDLRDSYFVWACPQRDAGAWRPKKRSQAKLYLVDPLLARLPHLRNMQWPTPDPTALVESQLGMALRRRLEAMRPGSWSEDDHLFYVRTPTRKEIDFLGPGLGSVAVEGKYTEGGTWLSEAATVNASEWTGILATRNVIDLGATGDGAWAVPASFVAYLIDT